MIVRHYLHTDPVVAISYLFGCGSKAAGAVVDVVAEPAFYLREAEALGLVIRYVIDTHVHADHVSTGRALAEAAGVEYVLHESAEADYAFRAVRGGRSLTTCWYCRAPSPGRSAAGDCVATHSPRLALSGATTGRSA